MAQKADHSMLLAGLASKCEQIETILLKALGSTSAQAETAGSIDELGSRDENTSDLIGQRMLLPNMASAERAEITKRPRKEIKLKKKGGCRSKDRESAF